MNKKLNNKFKKNHSVVKFNKKDVNRYDFKKKSQSFKHKKSKLKNSHFGVNKNWKDKIKSSHIKRRDSNNNNIKNNQDKRSSKYEENKKDIYDIEHIISSIIEKKVSLKKVDDKFINNIKTIYDMNEEWFILKKKLEHVVVKYVIKKKKKNLQYDNLNFYVKKFQKRKSLYDKIEKGDGEENGITINDKKEEGTKNKNEDEDEDNSDNNNYYDNMKKDSSFVYQAKLFLLDNEDILFDMDEEKKQVVLNSKLWNKKIKAFLKKKCTSQNITLNNDDEEKTKFIDYNNIPIHLNELYNNDSINKNVCVNNKSDVKIKIKLMLKKKISMNDIYHLIYNIGINMIYNYYQLYLEKYSNDEEKIHLEVIHNKNNIFSDRINNIVVLIKKNPLIYFIYIKVLIDFYNKKEDVFLKKSILECLKHIYLYILPNEYLLNIEENNQIVLHYILNIIFNRFNFKEYNFSSYYFFLNALIYIYSFENYLKKSFLQYIFILKNGIYSLIPSLFYLSANNINEFCLKKKENKFANLNIILEGYCILNKGNPLLLNFLKYLITLEKFKEYITNYIFQKILVSIKYCVDIIVDHLKNKNEQKVNKVDDKLKKDIVCINRCLYILYKMDSHSFNNMMENIIYFATYLFEMFSKNIYELYEHKNELLNEWSVEKMAYIYYEKDDTQKGMITDTTNRGSYCPITNISNGDNGQQNNAQYLDNYNDNNNNNNNINEINIKKEHEDDLNNEQKINKKNISNGYNFNTNNKSHDNNGEAFSSSENIHEKNISSDQLNDKENELKDEMNDISAEKEKSQKKEDNKKKKNIEENIFNKYCLYGYLSSKVLKLLSSILVKNMYFIIYNRCLSLKDKNNNPFNEKTKKIEENKCLHSLNVLSFLKVIKSVESYKIKINFLVLMFLLLYSSKQIDDNTYCYFFSILKDMNYYESEHTYNLYSLLTVLILTDNNIIRNISFIKRIFQHSIHSKELWTHVFSIMMIRYLILKKPELIKYLYHEENKLYENNLNYVKNNYILKFKKYNQGKEVNINDKMFIYNKSINNPVDTNSILTHLYEFYTFSSMLNDNFKSILLEFRNITIFNYNPFQRKRYSSIRNSVHLDFSKKSGSLIKTEKEHKQEEDNKDYIKSHDNTTKKDTHINVNNNDDNIHNNNSSSSNNVKVNNNGKNSSENDYDDDDDLVINIKTKYHNKNEKDIKSNFTLNLNIDEVTTSAVSMDEEPKEEKIIYNKQEENKEHKTINNHSHIRHNSISNELLYEYTYETSAVINIMEKLAIEYKNAKEQLNMLYTYNNFLHDSCINDRAVNQNNNNNNNNNNVDIKKPKQKLIHNVYQKYFYDILCSYNNNSFKKFKDKYHIKKKKAKSKHRQDDQDASSSDEEHEEDEFLDDYIRKNFDIDNDINIGDDDEDDILINNKFKRNQNKRKLSYGDPNNYKQEFKRKKTKTGDDLKDDSIEFTDFINKLKKKKNN
ncbi:large ribosomal subunit nuclear export factor, putative [Plasmodium gaboni]|uniref:Large ribosomal subunit nuclear export factor, putative n=1 Tax=Plasmodium gaboni TaxID=647221 RepID=A0ABY1UUP6_9APIC|nr:large ribosomal subunit nuclear export factor, putative [Plasmodium gaboni]